LAGGSCIVVDYGIGNVFSVMRALEYLSAEPRLSADPAEISRADRVILPGVGAFGRAAHRLRECGLEAPILEFIGTGRPFLGICVGMQLLMDIGTEFGEHRGLGLIKGSVNKINIPAGDTGKMRVPLIGWHPLHPPAGQDRSHWDGTPLADLPADRAFYFVHSFAADLLDKRAGLAVTRHNGHDVVAAVRRDNVIGTQFHPERSSDFGLTFLAGFLRQ
jgi:glutamine amidotransferase